MLSQSQLSIHFDAKMTKKTFKRLVDIIKWGKKKITCDRRFPLRKEFNTFMISPPSTNSIMVNKNSVLIRV